MHYAPIVKMLSISESDEGLVQRPDLPEPTRYHVFPVDIDADADRGEPPAALVSLHVADTQEAMLIFQEGCHHFAGKECKQSQIDGILNEPELSASI